VNTFSEGWSKLAKSKKYREAFVFSLFKRMVPFQIQSLRKQRHWSQMLLARNSNLTQGVISRAEDPDYGNLTIKTICRIAAGFDVAFIGKFVPFSELNKWYVDVTEKSVQIPSFNDEVLEPKRETEEVEAEPISAAVTAYIYQQREKSFGDDCTLRIPLLEKMIGSRQVVSIVPRAARQGLLPNELQMPPRKNTCGNGAASAATN
jgi:transcriptional regulator with XRE-family HTH domain